MQVIAKRALREFWGKYPDAEKPLSVWYKIVDAAQWNSPAEIKETFGTKVDFVGDNRVIFDIGGNKYRLIVRVAYAPFYRVLIKFVGTHEEYDKVDAEVVS